MKRPFEFRAASGGVCCTTTIDDDFRLDLSRLCATCRTVHAAHPFTEESKAMFRRARAAQGEAVPPARAASPAPAPKPAAALRAVSAAPGTAAAGSQRVCCAKCGGLKPVGTMAVPAASVAPATSPVARPAGPTAVQGNDRQGHHSGKTSQRTQEERTQMPPSISSFPPHLRAAMVWCAPNVQARFTLPEIEQLERQAPRVFSRLVREADSELSLMSLAKREDITLDYVPVSDSWVLTDARTALDKANGRNSKTVAKPTTRAAAVETEEEDDGEEYDYTPTDPWRVSSNQARR